MKRRTEGDVWREVARRLVEMKGKSSTGGLCRHRNLVTRGNWRLYSSTYDRLDSYMVYGFGWAYPYADADSYETHCNTHREARALAALWLACEADAEATL